MIKTKTGHVFVKSPNMKGTSKENWFTDSYRITGTHFFHNSQDHIKITLQQSQLVPLLDEMMMASVFLVIGRSHQILLAVSRNLAGETFHFFDTKIPLENLIRAKTQCSMQLSKIKTKQSGRMSAKIFGSSTDS